jgi:hypothetical protein
MQHCILCFARDCIHIAEYCAVSFLSVGITAGMNMTIAVQTDITWNGTEFDDVRNAIIHSWQFEEVVDNQLDFAGPRPSGPGEGPGGSP